MVKIVSLVMVCDWRNLFYSNLIIKNILYHPYVVFEEFLNEINLTVNYEPIFFFPNIDFPFVVYH